MKTWRGVRGAVRGRSSVAVTSELGSVVEERKGAEAKGLAACDVFLVGSVLQASQVEKRRRTTEASGRSEARVKRTV